MAERWVTATKLSELKIRGRALVSVEGIAIALFLRENAVYAIEDLCSHRGGPLSEGECENFEVTCPWHRAKFDLRTGEVRKGPAQKPLRSFETKIEGDEVKVLIHQTSP